MRNGLGPLVGLIVAGSLTSSMLLDHSGWFGVQQDSMNWRKIAGAALLVVGASLMQMKSK